MKRDFDLIRKMLFYIESTDNHIINITPSDLGYEDNEFSYNEIQYHVKLLYGADFLDMNMLPLTGNGNFLNTIMGLTWCGHDWLDSIRDDGVWNKTKDKITSTVSSVGFEMVKTVAKEITKSLIFK